MFAVQRATGATTEAAAQPSMGTPHVLQSMGNGSNRWSLSRETKE